MFFLLFEERLPIRPVKGAPVHINSKIEHMSEGLQIIQDRGFNRDKVFSESQ
jgi:hypothetical protein